MDCSQFGHELRLARLSVRAARGARWDEMRLMKRREQVVGAWVTEFPDGHGGTIHHTSRNAPYRHQFCPNHPRQSPTIRSSSSHFPVFGSPTATIEVAGNTGNPSSEKAGVGGSIPSLATIIANRLTCFFMFASASNWSAPGGKLSLFLSNCGQPTLKKLQLSI